MKTEVKAIESECDSYADIETIALTALSSVTTQDCLNWIKNCNIYT